MTDWLASERAAQLCELRNCDTRDVLQIVPDAAANPNGMF